MESYNIHRAKTQFSKLVERVENGEEILIARAGLPVARLIAEKKTTRRPGRLKGKIRIKKGFYDPLPDDILKAFSGNLS